MKLKTSWLPLMGLILLGCDNSEEYFQSLNVSPQISITSSGEVGMNIVDSLKLSTANNFYTKDIVIFYDDRNAHVSNLEVSSTTNDVFIIQEDTLLISDYLELKSMESDTIKLTLFCYNPGFKKLVFTVKDQFQVEREATLDLIVFVNLQPVVEYSYLIDSENKFIYFDLGNSYDPDSVYGGRIVSYEIDFSGEQFVRSRGNFTIIYSDDRTIYDVNFTVQDNDGEYSITKAERITL